MPFLISVTERFWKKGGCPDRVGLSALFISGRQVDFSNDNSTFKPPPPNPQFPPRTRSPSQPLTSTPTPTAIWRKCASIWRNVLHAFCAITGNPEPRLCSLLSHFLLLFITFNTYSRYEPGTATQWRYADVWAFRSGTYWNLKHRPRTSEGYMESFWDGHASMMSLGCGPVEPMLSHWWRWCFYGFFFGCIYVGRRRSCLALALHILYTSKSIAAVLNLIESTWQFVMWKNEKGSERSRPFFCVRTFTCDIITKYHRGLS